MSDVVLVQRENDIATVILNSPEKLNALTKSMWQNLGEAMNALSEEEDLRCIVIRGAGDKAFAAGADISEFNTARATSSQARAYGALVHGAMRAVANCRHPTVALIQGVCVGGGLEIASTCDLRICGESSRFGVPIKRLGLVMAYGELRALVSVVGRAAALEILLEGRVFDAHEAFAKGLVTRVVPDDRVPDETYAAARRIAQGAPLVARWHKKFIARLEDPSPLSDTELAEGFACFDTEDYRIGREAFLAKTKPEFKGR
jgi:enoyl-CoA hydratase/carnithine racemase